MSFYGVVSCCGVASCFSVVSCYGDNMKMLKVLCGCCCLRAAKVRWAFELFLQWCGCGKLLGVFWTIEVLLAIGVLLAILVC